jgi:hypothetical protein
MSRQQAQEEINVKRHLASQIARQAHKMPECAGKFNVLSQKLRKSSAELERYFRIEHSIG